jgi:transcriptional regulator with XRE-family HTH domain
MTQSELVEAMKEELGRGLSQAYVSQLESGARPHMTNTSRELLARFFRVFPGFLVDDPEGYSRELQSALRMGDSTVDSWLYAGSDQFSADPELEARPVLPSGSARFCSPARSSVRGILLPFLQKTNFHRANARFDQAAGCRFSR